MSRFAILILVGIVAGSAASRTAAADETDPRLGTVTVQYSLVELQSRQGITHLYARLNAAAREVCQYYDPVDLLHRRAFYRCVSLSLDRAVTQVHDPALSAYHEQHAHVPWPLSVVAHVSTGGTDRVR